MTQALTQRAIAACLAAEEWHRRCLERIGELDQDFRRQNASPRLTAPWAHFTRGLREHFAIEESRVFPAIRAMAHGKVPEREDFAGPLHDLRFELDELRTIADALANAAPEAGAREADLLALLDELEEHARREEKELFPLAMELLSGAAEAPEPAPSPRVVRPVSEAGELPLLEVGDPEDPALLARLGEGPCALRVRLGPDEDGQRLGRAWTLALRHPSVRELRVLGEDPHRLVQAFGCGPASVSPHSIALFNEVLVALREAFHAPEREGLSWATLRPAGPGVDTLFDLEALAGAARRYRAEREAHPHRARAALLSALVRHVSAPEAARALVGLARGQTRSAVLMARFSAA